MTKAPAHPTRCHIDAALADLRSLITIYDEAAKRMDDALPGSPGAAHYDGSGSRPADGTSSTERIGIQLAESGSRTRTICEERDNLTRALRRDAARLLKIIGANAPRPADPKAKREAEKANDAVPECAWTRRLLGTFEPARTKTPSDVNGTLSEPMLLGDWVYRFVRQQGRLPQKAELERHERGQRVHVPA